MKITVTVKTKARVELVKQIDDTHYAVSVKTPPVEGKANEAVIRALAGSIGIAQSRITLVKGHTAKQKVFDILI
ncbi:MAG: DUF167 domain-containing protein [Patescibacteria group bacterium]